MNKNIENNPLEQFKAQYLLEHADLIKFPNEIYIAYAVCKKSCGNKEFIIDGDTQVCSVCGHQMFRTEISMYILDENENSYKKIIQKVKTQPIALTYPGDNVEINGVYPEVEPSSVCFPKELNVSYAVCINDGQSNELIVEGSTDICEYCGSQMAIISTRKYLKA